MIHNYPLSKTTSSINVLKFNKKVYLIIAFSLLIINHSVCQNAVTTVCGTSSQGSPLSGPYGLAVSPVDGNIYLADYTSHTLFNINANTGSETVYSGTGTMGYVDGALSIAQFYYPSGIAFTSDGMSMYVADNANCLIRKVDLTTQMVSTAAGVYNAYAYEDNINGSLAKFNQPVDLVVAPGDSIIYISDSENHLIRKLNLITTEVTTVAGLVQTAGSTNGNALTSTFRNPSGIALSANGKKLFIADPGNHLIRVLDLDSNTVITLAGISGTTGTANGPGSLASFNTPKGVKVSKNDSLLYVMDTFNNLIRVININTTEVATLAGSASTSSSHFQDHSIGLMAQFWHPVSCALSNDGSKLYLSDQENFRLRQMETDIVTKINFSIPDNSFSIYPNPTTNYLIISNSINKSIASVIVYSAIGNKILEEYIHSNNINYELSLKSLTPGIYTISIQAVSGELFNQQFIVK
jgi:DNA-binding beta-propeller fold protein YncE